MKGFRFFTGGCVFVLILSALAFAQIEKTQTSAPNKIAGINTEAFYDKEAGIKEVVEANDKLETEFKSQKDELRLLGEKIQNLQKEIEELAKPQKVGCYPSIQNKVDEYKKLISEYKRRQDDLKSLYDKRKPEIFADIYKKVGEAIKQFAKENGYVIVLDSSKDNSSTIIEGETIDITKEFIKYYNDNFAKTQ